MANPNWVKGVSGNPTGRPKDSLGSFLREKGRLPQEIYDSVHPLLKSPKEQTRIWAAEFLRDSTWGKPTQMLSVDPENNKIIVEFKQ